MPNGESKNWVRFCAAIDGFRADYKSWPNRVRVPKFFIEELKTVLSPESFAKLESKINLIGDESHFIAEDGTGRSFNYEFDRFSKIKLDIRAYEWLGVNPDYYD